MELIHINEYGYGFDGKTLDLEIAIPKDSYLENFWVVSQTEVNEDSTTETGIDILKHVVHTKSREEAFHKAFSYIGDITDKDNGNIYNIYKLKSDVLYHKGDDVVSGITISKEDLTFVTMRLNISKVDKNFKLPRTCGEDGTVVVLPVYDACAVRLKAFSSVEFILGYYHILL